MLVEPATVEDWELLEIYSNFMEEGGLLGQVSVVYPGQHLAMRIGGLDRVRIRVKEVTSRVTSNPTNDVHQIWPDISSEGTSSSKHHKKKKSPPKCVLLIQDTEMVVESKSRRRKRTPSWLDPFRLIPSDMDWGSSFEVLNRLTRRGSFHVDPGCILVKADEWPFESEWAQIKPDDSNELRLVRVMTSSRIPRNNAGTVVVSYFTKRSPRLVEIWNALFDDEQ